MKTNFLVLLSTLIVATSAVTASVTPSTGDN